MKRKVCLVAFIAFFIDQIVKSIIVNAIGFYERIVVIPNFFSLTCIKNEGAAWGILNGNVFLLIIITIVAIIFILKSIIDSNETNKLNMVFYGLLLGGIVGNLFDRIIHNYVIDFLDFKIFGYNFPVFNIADTLIVISSILLFFMFLKGDKNETNSK